MSTYLRPSWLQRHVESVVMTWLPGQPTLRMRGRLSGRMRTIPVRPVRVADARYLVALLGDTNWARNLRAAGSAVLVERRVTREFRAVEVFGEERAAAVAAYLATSTYGPTIRLLTQRLPDPADHPVFRIDDVGGR
jgi:deazaflavin-dependent oxidoreductase (nitroreductase family)